jgi:7,8-didemethyl-8-hydroxy-5-deazariboflavin synthase
MHSLTGRKLINEAYAQFFVSPLPTSTTAITYSPAYTIVPTYDCFNRCTYCNFRTDPGHRPWLTLESAQHQLQALPSSITEILILSGEVHPHHPDRSAWFQRIYDLSQLALDLGFLPHTNAGPLSRAEMAQLAQVNVSMGLMLEQDTPALLQTVHRHAPSKHPEIRRQQLIQAGELRIPFTTGILLGLGEADRDRQASLTTIAQIHQQYGHIQEVILQPYSPGTTETWAGLGFDLHQMPTIIHQARQILPPDIRIQIPPNLVAQPDLLLACLAAGATDLGGISPHDEVNPDYPHPTVAQLRSLLPPQYQLQPRLPLYPSHYSWLPKHLQKHLAFNIY